MVLKWLLPLMYYGALSFVYNIEEIEHLKYGIEINAHPVLRSQLPELEHIIMKSKYDQEYSCIIPNVATKENKDTDLENVFKSFASRFMSNQCIHRTKGWWTYRVCYGNIIQQYHQPDRRMQGVLPEEVSILGRYDRDMNWTQELSNPSIKYYEQMPVAHKQYFLNGDFCGDSGMNRQATVSYVCDPDANSDFIALIDERTVCVYKIVIHTARMCKHDFFMPGHTAVKHRISCSPIVSSVKTPEKQERRPKIAKPLLAPSWVGNNPTSDNYSLKNYLEDVADEEKQAPLRALKKMFKSAVNEMKSDINKLKKLNDRGNIKNPELADINLDNISDDDLSNIFQSEELESTINRLAKSTQQQVEAWKHKAQQLQQKPAIEIKVIYRDADGNVKISDADRNTPEIHETVLRLMDAGTEERVETRRLQTLQNAYHFVDPSMEHGESDPDGNEPASDAGEAVSEEDTLP
ncbi:protein OS-9-like [Bolinopsis microptera]|uniref:protein OS-9-like n=1 Tax=Bolinopsis microptera TaxID=2820187 RepID=UPI00307A39E7